MEMKAAIMATLDVVDVLLNPIGPVIGSHSGAGTIAVFYLGNDRRQTE
jgi:fatty acid-binding protein DegV